MKFAAPLLRILALLAVAIAGMVMAQDRLLYFPERVPLAGLLTPGVTPWPSAEDFRALRVEPAGRVRGTVLVFHGNAGHAGHRLFYADALAPLGLRVLLVEYPGYGPRDGELGEASFTADAAVTIAQAEQAFGPVLVLGESLGAAVAAAASARLQHRGIAALLLVTPWDTLASVAEHHYRWLPRWLISLLLRDRYDSIANLQGFPAPVAVILAERDSIVPAAHGRALYESLGPGRGLRVIAGADHNDWSDRVDERWWLDLWAEVMQETAPVD